MIFTGHEHNYERTYPVYRDQVDSCEDPVCIYYSAVQTTSADLPVQHGDQVESCKDPTCNPRLGCAGKLYLLPHAVRRMD